MVAFDSFEEAYVSRLKLCMLEPTYRNAPRGFPSREVLGASYRLRNIRRRVVVCPARRSNIVFNFAEALWYFSGTDDLAYLAYYAPSVVKFSVDGQRLTGTAYGPRIRRSSTLGTSQWENVVRVLREDSDSKRAVIQIFQADELGIASNPDVACTLGIQFLVRSSQLHAIGYMRANDVYRGMVSDIYSFTFLQELMARELGIDVGEYIHIVGSLHMYESDQRCVEAVVNCPRQAGLPDNAMPPMPLGDNAMHIREVMAWEESLRTNRRRLGRSGLAGLALPEYWLQVVILFELYRRIHHRDPSDDGLELQLWPLYRHLMVGRFPMVASR